MKNEFPDNEYLLKLAKDMGDKFANQKSAIEQIVTYSGAELNSIGDVITDTGATWEKKILKIDDLTLTPTNPRWNKIMLEECRRSPILLRKRLNSDSQAREMFANVPSKDLPILVRWQDKKYKVRDGMHRTIAAIRDGKKEIEAYIISPGTPPRASCEPHVVYDFIRAYQRGLNKDFDGLVVSLRFLRKSYSNVESLLKERFNKDWVNDEEIQKAITESLGD